MTESMIKPPPVASGACQPKGMIASHFKRLANHATVCALTLLKENGTDGFLHQEGVWSFLLVHCQWKSVASAATSEERGDTFPLR